MPSAKNVRAHELQAIYTPRPRSLNWSRVEFYLDHCYRIGPDAARHACASDRHTQILLGREGSTAAYGRGKAAAKGGGTASAGKTDRVRQTPSRHPTKARVLGQQQSGRAQQAVFGTTFVISLGRAARQWFHGPKSY